MVEFDTYKEFDSLMTKRSEKEYSSADINYDCKHFKGDRPCTYHKKEGVYCEECRYYEPIRYQILIIKLNAVGDVLRTTCILPALREKYKNAWITWVTEKEATQILKTNLFVDEIIELGLSTLLKLQTVVFDIVINLDAAPKSAMLATIAKGKEKFGFTMNQKGFVYPVNVEADEWFRMGIFDDRKKGNKKTYQQIVKEICKLPLDSNSELILNLTDEEKQFSKDFAQKHQLHDKKIIGLNTGAGGRWEFKKWTIDGFLDLAKLLRKEFKNCNILLYGGPEEKERNKYLKQKMPELIDTGCNNSLRQFAALIELCDILVTGDTLAMHIAIALKKKVVVLFGPTSHSEIELYGRGKKIVSPLSCIGCYKTSCDLKPNCMESITPQLVLKNIMALKEKI